MQVHLVGCEVFETHKSLLKFIEVLEMCMLAVDNDMLSMLARSCKYRKREDQEIKPLQFLHALRPDKMSCRSAYASYAI